MEGLDTIMTVAVQKGLEHLTEALRGYGLDVVVYGEYQYPVDALVYMGEKMPMGESMPLTQSVSSANHAHHGVFMINARGKSADEIAQILNRRTYTPLF